MDQQWLQQCPKIELHVHLESSMHIDCLFALHQQAVEDPLNNAQALADALRYQGVHDFLEKWTWKSSFIQTYEDYEHLAASAAQAQADDGIIYCEFFFSPFAAKANGLAIPQVVDAILQGLRSEARLQSKLIADLTRDYGERECLWMLEELMRISDSDLVGIGLGGSEHQFPAKLFKRLFEEARHARFHCNVHAGEMSGSQSIYDAVKLLQAERIGHATHCEYDSFLIEYMLEHHVCIEACPWSNICSKVVKTLEEHSFRMFKEAGVPVCINTDNPLLTGHRLSDELWMLSQTFGYNEADICAFQRDALGAAWLDHDQRAGIQAQLDSFQEVS